MMIKSDINNSAANGMVVSMVNGRLGNVMFEISAALSYAKKYGKGDVKFVIKDKMLTPVGFYDKILSKFEFKNTSDIPNDVQYRLFKESQDFSFVEIPNICGNVILDGYFQSEKYFDIEYIKNTFNITEPDRKRISEKYKGISDGIGISVRRGDYLGLQDIFTVMPSEWYMDVYSKHFNGRKCFITSDDINWCRKNIRIDNAVYIDDCADDSMMAVALCRDHIMSSSTFSWWCCWLDEKKDSINIFPDRWFNPKSGIDDSNILPDRWIKE